MEIIFSMKHNIWQKSSCNVIRRNSDSYILVSSIWRFLFIPHLTQSRGIQYGIMEFSIFVGVTSMKITRRKTSQFYYKDFQRIYCHIWAQEEVTEALFINKILFSNSHSNMCISDHFTFRGLGRFFYGLPNVPEKWGLEYKQK